MSYSIFMQIIHELDGPGNLTVSSLQGSKIHETKLRMSKLSELTHRGTNCSNNKLETSLQLIRSSSHNCVLLLFGM